MRIGVVLAGGASTHQQVPAQLRDSIALGNALVVAADSGLDLAERLGIVANIVVGDFDSVTPDALQRARDSGIEIQQHPTAKDETDLELALAVVLEAAVDRIVVLGGAGGRLDHLLANIAAIARPTITVPIEAWLGTELFVVVDHRWSESLSEGTVVSVIPWNGPATVSEGGVRWPLDHHVLAAGATQGISNESLGGLVEITVHDGRCIVVVPDAKELS